MRKMIENDLPYFSYCSTQYEIEYTYFSNRKYLSKCWAVNPINGTSVVLARIEFFVPKCSLGMRATFLFVTFPNYVSN